MEEHAPTNLVGPSSTEPLTNLLSLPSELLLIIFSFVGFENFRQDVRRLAVSKNWYAYARPIILSNLRLNSEDLQPLLLAMEGSTTLAAVQKATKQIDLVLAGRDSHNDAMGAMFLLHQIVSSVEELAYNLEDFAALRTLIISTRGLLTIMPSGLLPSFASLNQLTSLKVDLAPFVFKRNSTHHVCESISQLIPNLEILHCRLPRICDDLLKSPPGGLKELIINIGCENGGTHPIHCAGHFPCGHDNLRNSLKTCLLQLAASMRDPKIVRLIYNLHPDHRLYAFDAIEDRRFYFGDSTAWDADCLLLPEDWNTDDEIENDEESDDDTLYTGERYDDREHQQEFYLTEDSDNYRDCGYTNDEESDDEGSDDEGSDDEGSDDEGSDEE